MKKMYFLKDRKEAVIDRLTYMSKHRQEYLQDKEHGMITLQFKQGMPVMLALLGGWLYAVLVGVGGVLLGKVMPPALALGLFAVATLVLSVVLYRWLKTKGSALFAAL